MNSKEYISEIRLFLFDMDGTIYRGNELFDFTVELLERIKAHGKKYMFMTNNSSKSVNDYIEKLERLGIKAEKDDFITSAQATAIYLLKNCPDEKLYVCGTGSFKGELREYGLTVTEKLDEVDCVVMASDSELTFKKINDISYLLTVGNPRYIATNPDDVVPTEYGVAPDCGSVCDMIYNATGKRPLVIGKPEAAMPRIAMEWTGMSLEETAAIGDRIDTDIKCGLNAGCKTILVKTGGITDEEIENSPDKPELVLTSAKEILEALK